jgi:hypothetical protein
MLYLFWNTILSLKIPSSCGCNITEYNSYNWTRQNQPNANLTFKNLQNAQNAQNTFSTFCWCTTSPNICCLPLATYHMPSTKHFTPYSTTPGTWRVQFSMSLDRACRGIHEIILLSEIGSVFHVQSVLGSVEPSMLRMYHQVQLAVYLRAFWELNWQHTVKQTECVPSSAIGSILETMPGSVLENILRGILGSVLRVYLGMSWKFTWKHIVNQAGSILKDILGMYLKASWELTWKRKSSKLKVCHEEQLGVYFRVYFRVDFRVYLEAYNEVHLATCVRVGCI